MTFGEKIKFIREKNGLTQLDLAKRMNVSQQAVAKYEKIVEQPKLATIRRLANALDVKLYELVIDWTQFSSEELKDDFTKIDEKLYGVEAPSEMQQKFTDHMLNRQNNISAKRKALDEKIDHFNDDGIQKMSDYADDIMLNPKYRKEPE